MSNRPIAKPKAYSYIRFSTPEQMRGDSLRRQTEAAERYAALHGLELDDKLTFQDLGVSAFRGRNRAEGMLGEFLELVRSGDIAIGSYLLVENLDRVSRENALDALDALKDIAKEGITVVTLNDGRAYTHESLRQNPVDLMVAVMVFMRANEESATKAKRLREAWGAKRAKAEKQPLTKLSPGWVRLRDDRSGFDLIPERAAIVRRIFEMAIAGKGQQSIAETLNREGVPVFGRGKHWHRSYVKKMLGNPAVIGQFTPHRMEIINGKRVRVPAEPVEDYFPQAVSREVFEQVAALASGRSAPSKTEGAMANILAGLAKCPRCGSTMTRVNKGGKKGGHPYLICTRAKAGAGCTYRKVRLDHVTRAIIDNAGYLIGELPSPEADLQAQWDQLSLAHDVMGDEIERVVQAIAEAGHSPALLNRLRATEAERDRIANELSSVATRMADTITNRIANTGTALLDAVGEQPHDIPKVNAVLRQLFGKVVVDYRSGSLVFHWNHVPDAATSIVYGWPTETDDDDGIIPATSLPPS
ncbi:recombinase family protein [Aquamicrobium defluvii]|nr:recombinase family protein [Aquamicrobium defluvii]